MSKQDFLKCLLIQTPPHFVPRENGLQILPCNISIYFNKTLIPTTLIEFCYLLIFSQTNPLVSLGVWTVGGILDTWLQHVSWTPSGGLVIIHQNNIYHQPSPGDRRMLRLTSDGLPGVVFNGALDWLYKGR